SIDWLSWPRFDARSVFAKILDAERGGCFSIAPSIPFSSTRRYIEATNVLETTYETDRGSVRLLDLMPALDEEEKRTRMLPFRQLLRRVEGISGDVPMIATYEPRPDYARVKPNLEFRRADTVWCASGPEVWHLRSDTKLDIEGPTAY